MDVPTRVHVYCLSHPHRCGTKSSAALQASSWWALSSGSEGKREREKEREREGEKEKGRDKRERERESWKVSYLRVGTEAISGLAKTASWCFISSGNKSATLLSQSQIVVLSTDRTKQTGPSSTPSKRRTIEHNIRWCECSPLVAYSYPIHQEEMSMLNKRGGER